MGKDSIHNRAARIGLVSLALITTSCNEILERTDTLPTPTAIVQHSGESTAIPPSRPTLAPEKQRMLQRTAEQRLINNPVLSAWRQSLPDDTRVTLTVYGKKQKNTVNAPPTDDSPGGLFTRSIPDRKGEITYPTYLHDQPIETELTITLSHPDGSRAQWDLVDEHLGGHFAAASITSSAEKGLITERYITRQTLSDDILSFVWNKRNNTLERAAQEPPVIIVLYDRQPPKPE